MGPNFFHASPNPPCTGGSHHLQSELYPSCAEEISLKTTACKLFRRKEKQAQKNISLLPFPRHQKRTQQQRIKIKDDSSFKASPEDQRQRKGKDRIWDGGEKGPRSQRKAVITIISNKLTSPLTISCRALPGSFAESSVTKTKMRHFSKNTKIKFYWQIFQDITLPSLP